MTDYITKDSGEREQYDSGMQRDTEAGKPRFDLMVPEGVPYEEQLLTRFAMLLSRGAEKYDARNWEKAGGEEEIARAKSSAFRHFFQWITGETDEDHAAAVIFNLMVVETTERKLGREAVEERFSSPHPGDILPCAGATEVTIEVVNETPSSFSLPDAVQEAVNRRSYRNKDYVPPLLEM